MIPLPNTAPTEPRSAPAILLASQPHRLVHAAAVAPVERVLHAALADRATLASVEVAPVFGLLVRLRLSSPSLGLTV